MTRQTSGPSPTQIIRVKNGTLYEYSTGKSLGVSLSTEKYTKIEIRFYPNAQAYDIYVDGVKRTATPVALTETTADYSYYVISAARLFNFTYKNEGMMYVDNIAMYYDDERIALHDTLNNAGIIDSDIIALTDLNTYRALDGTIDFKYPYIGGYSALDTNFLRIYYNNTTVDTVEWRNDNGNGYLGFKKNAAAGYVDLVNGTDMSVSNINSTIAPRVNKAISEGKRLNVRMDIKGSDYIAGGALVVMHTRYLNQDNNGKDTPRTCDLIKAASNGLLSAVDYSTGSAKEVSLGHYLSKNEFTTIGISLDIANSTYQVYINGVPSEKEFKYSLVTDGYDIAIPTNFRIYQRSNFANDSIGVDNLAIYYGERYVETAVSVSAYRLSLKGDIGVQTYVNIPEKLKGSSDIYAKFVVDGVESIQTLAEADVNATYGHGFECKVNATQMTSEVKFELYYGNALLVTDSYSVAEYAKEILTNDAYESVRPTVKAMLNYGSISQDYFDVEADDPASDCKYTTELGEVTYNEIKELSVNKASGAVTGLEYSGSWLELRSTPVLYHQFSVTGDISEYTFKLGDTVLSPVQISGSLYAVPVKAVYAQNMDVAYAVTVTKGAEEYTLKYNAMNYLKLAYVDPALNSLASSLYLFHKEASAYFNSIQVSASVMKAKDGKSGIITIVHDDGTLSTARYLSSALGQYGFKGTVGMVADYVITKSGDPEFSYDEGTTATATFIETTNTEYIETEYADTWRAIIAEGNLDIASHTQTHRWYGIDDNASSGTFILSSAGTVVTYEFLDGHMTGEIVGSAERLRLVFADQEQRVLTYVITGWPAANNGRTEAAIKMIAENYISARSSAQGINEYGSISYHGLKEMAIYDTTTVKDMTDYVDSVISAEAWGIYCFHQIKSGSAESGAYQGNVDQLLKYMYDNNVWGASLEQATMYVKEYESSNLDIKVVGDSIQVTLTDTLDNEIYDMGLTVKVTVPAKWDGVAVTYGNGTNGTLNVSVDDNGARYVMVDIVPDSGTVTLNGAY